MRHDANQNGTGRDWETVTLGSIASFKTGKLDSNAATENGEYPFFTCSPVTFRTDTFAFEGESVLLAGNNANGIFPIKYFKGQFNAYQRTYVLSSTDTARLDNRFLYYALQLQLDLLRRLSTGAATKFLTLGILNNLEIQLPPLPTQRRIADILSAYDDLIENNTRRIAILEEMAQRLYQEWFVHFRYPGHENVPLVDSELGPIPEGWEIRTLNSACTLIRSGGTPSRRVMEYWEYPTILWFKTKELNDGFLFSSEESISDVGLKNSNAILFDPDTILMAIYAAPTVGRLGILTTESACNQAALGLVSNYCVAPQSYLFYKLRELRPQFNRTSQGAAQQNISKEKVANTLAVFPPLELSTRFHRIVNPSLSLLQSLSRSNKTAAIARDLLLLRLTDGSIQSFGV